MKTRVTNYDFKFDHSRDEAPGNYSLSFFIYK